MRLCWKGFAAPAVLLAGLLAAPAPVRATSCTTQAELQPQDRDALTAAGGRLAVAVAEQDFAALKAALLPAVAQDWEGMRGVVESSASLMKGGQIQLRSLYLLDAQPGRARRHAVLLHQRERRADRDPDHAGAAAGPLRRGAGRCGRSALRRPVGLHPGLGRPRQRLEAGRPDRPARALWTGRTASGGGRTPAIWPATISRGRLVRLRDRADAAAAGGFSLLAQPGKARKRAGGDQEFSAQTRFL
jgi:hypothetical protein